MLYSITELQKFYSDALEDYSLPSNFHNLYEPVNYLLRIGGKRIRPILALASYNIFKEDIANALPMAHAVEYFHNFSLMHDDIMDKADLRRGKETVHKKYDLNTAILSGDVMLIYAYQFIEQCPVDKQPEILKLFNKASKEICEGQQMDIDFESSTDVSIEDYLQMITHKTAVLLGASMQYGAILAEVSKEDANHLFNFGKNMGIAFQVQDDILDIFSESSNSGKIQGGDILQKKKTYLYLKSLELLSESDSSRLKQLYTEDLDIDDQEFITEVTQLFNSAHVKTYAQELKLSYQQLAFSHLDAVVFSNDRKEVVREFAIKLLDRES